MPDFVRVLSSFKVDLDRIVVNRLTMCLKYTNVLSELSTFGLDTRYTNRQKIGKRLKTSMQAAQGDTNYHMPVRSGIIKELRMQTSEDENPRLDTMRNCITDRK